MKKAVTARPSKHDREIAAIRKLICVGTRLVRDTDQKLNRLAGQRVAFKREMRQTAAINRESVAIGRETKRDLQRLIRSLERGGNGRGPSSH